MDRVDEAVEDENESDTTMDVQVSLPDDPDYFNDAAVDASVDDGDASDWVMIELEGWWWDHMILIGGLDIGNHWCVIDQRTVMGRWIGLDGEYLLWRN